MNEEPTLITYTPPAKTDREPLYIVRSFGGPEECRYVFYDGIEIGRHVENRKDRSGVLMIRDATVSRRHCTIHRTQGDHCVIRDVSSNGTWLDGRRLVPNLEFDIRFGQEISLGNNQKFRLVKAGADSMDVDLRGRIPGTLKVTQVSDATVMVGDIRNYTELVRETMTTEVQESVSRVFQRLEREVLRHGGAIKEYLGDAIFAFWEQNSDVNHAVSACRAALNLHRLVKELASDRSVWNIPTFPLWMDWALATGEVAIKNVGGDHPTGLSMVGEVVIWAFRIEKLANDATGPILVSAQTAQLASGSFEFRELDPVQVKGFDEATQVFALLGESQLGG